MKNENFPLSEYVNLKRNVELQKVKKKSILKKVSILLFKDIFILITKLSQSLDLNFKYCSENWIWDNKNFKNRFAQNLMYFLLVEKNCKIPCEYLKMISLLCKSTETTLD